MLGIPFLGACEKFIAPARKMKLVFNEDNQSALQFMKTGKNSTMRHLPRAHGICISALHAYCHLSGVLLVYILSEFQNADIFTKCFKLAPTWQQVSNLIGMSLTGTKGVKAFNVLAPAPKKPRLEQATTDNQGDALTMGCAGLRRDSAHDSINHNKYPTREIPRRNPKSGGILQQETSVAGGYPGVVPGG